MKVTEDYCSYEVAKLLKSKGFNDVYSKGDCTAFACTHQMAMKWLRGNNIIIIPQPEYFSCDKCESWGIDIWAGGNYEKSLRGFPTYEEAVEAALKYSLENLI